MTQKTFLFDIGRVLIEWNPQNLMKSLLPEGTQPERDKLDSFFHGLAKKWDMGSYEETREKAKIDFPDYAHFIDGHAENVFKHGIGNVIEGTVDLMNRLKDKGHRLIAASNFARDMLDDGYQIGRMDFLDLFDEKHISGQIGIIKPDPRFFTTLLDSYDVNPNTAFFTDDLQDNIDAAQSCGIDGALFTTPEALEAELIKRQVL